MASVFLDVAEAKTFHRRVGVYLAMIDNADHGVGFAGYLLAEVVRDHAPRVHNDELECASDGHLYPCRTMLAVVGISELNVDWDETAAIDAILSANFPYVDLVRVDESKIEIRNDPMWRYEQNGEGSWAVAVIERGVTIQEELVASTQLIDHLLKTVVAMKGRPFPYGWLVESDEIEELKPAARQRAASWSETAALPFIKNAESELQL